VPIRLGQKRKMFSGGEEGDGELRVLAEPLMWPFILVGVRPFCFAISAACLRVRTLGEPFMMAESMSFEVVWPVLGGVVLITKLGLLVMRLQVFLAM